MSKIQFNELNNTSLEVLDNNAASEVVGGIFDFQQNVASLVDSDTLANVQSALFGSNVAANSISSGNTIIQTNAD